MSYEGVVQFLCLNGHLETRDSYGAPTEWEFKCSICGAGCEVSQSTDETNGAEPEDYLESRLEVVTPPTPGVYRLKGEVEAEER